MRTGRETGRLALCEVGFCESFDVALVVGRCASLEVWREKRKSKQDVYDKSFFMLQPSAVKGEVRITLAAVRRRQKKQRKESMESVELSAVSDLVGGAIAKRKADATARATLAGREILVAESLANAAGA